MISMLEIKPQCFAHTEDMLCDWAQEALTMVKVLGTLQ